MPEKISSLQTGHIYDGEIHAVDPFTGRMDVMVGNVHLKNVIYMPRIIGAMLGFNERMVPDKGTAAKILYESQGEAYVIGCANDRKEIYTQERVYNTSGQPDLPEQFQVPFGDDKSTRPGGYANADMIPGEYQMSNIMDVGVTFLTRIVKMHASQLARVECCLQDEMVRIVSRTFRHISPLGETEIYHDGRTSSRTTEGSWSHERRGFEKGLGGFDQPEDRHEQENRYQKKDPEDMQTTEVLAKFQEYRGWLGDFVHKFVTEPEKILGEGLKPVGRWREHVGAKGNYLMQSVDEIVFEKVIKIPVPEAKAKWFQNKQAKKGEMQRWNPDYFKAWVYKNDDNYYIHHAAFQLREYARWFSGYQSYARFHQTEDWGEYEVPSEAETDDHERDAFDADREETNQGIESGEPDDYTEVYSTFRLFKDGSFLIYDGNGVAVHSFQGNLFLSSRKNIRMEAGQDIVMIAGNDLIGQAKRNIELSAIVGGILIKARAWWEALCEKGSMLLESFAKLPDDTDPAPDGDCDDPEPRVGDYAVMIRSNAGRVGVDGDRKVEIIHRGTPVEDEESDDKEPGVEIISKTADFRTNVMGRTSFQGMGPIDLFTRGGNIRMKSTSIIMNPLSDFRVVDRMRVDFAGLIVKRGVKTDQLIARRIFNEKFEQGFPQHASHVFGLDGDNDLLDIPEERLEDNDPEMEEDKKDIISYLNDIPRTPEQTFNYVDPADPREGYKKDVVSDGEEYWMESLVNQHLRLDNLSRYDEDYEDLSQQDKRLQEVDFARTDFLFPYPGQPGNIDQLRLDQSDLQELNQPLGTKYKDLENTGTPLTPRDFMTRIVRCQDD